VANIGRPPCDEGAVRASRASAPCTSASAPWVLAATIIGSAMAFIDGTVTNVALPQARLNIRQAPEVTDYGGELAISVLAVQFRGATWLASDGRPGIEKERRVGLRPARPGLAGASGLRQGALHVRRGAWNARPSPKSTSRRWGRGSKTANKAHMLVVSVPASSHSGQTTRVLILL
jgi:hypothetical protein